MTGRYERQLLGAFEAVGWAGIRAPSSGSRTSRDLPDLLVGSPVFDEESSNQGPYSDCLAIELKTTSSTTAYADDSEVDGLQRFARTFGATPYLGARFKRTGQRSRYWLVPPGAARVTDSNAYGLPADDITERAEMLVMPGTPSSEPELHWL